MKEKMTFALAALVILGAVGCAQREVNKEVEQEMTEQPMRPMHGGVAYKGFEAIESSKSLNADQKRKLGDLHENMIGEVFSIQEETAKLKGVLFETITAAPYRADKVEVIKKRLVALNDQKMNSMFRALSEAEKILGRVPADQRQEIYQGLFFNEPRVQVRGAK